MGINLTLFLSIVAIVNVILSLIIFSRGIKSIPNIFFGSIAISTAIWCVAMIGFYNDQYKYILNWIVITHIMALLISYCFLIFSLNFPKRIYKNKIVVIIPSILSIIFGFLIISSDQIIGRTIDYVYELGDLYLLFAFIIISFFVSGFFFMFKQFFNAGNDVEKKQIQYILAGSFIASTLAMVFDLIFPFIGIFKFTWLGPIFTLIMVISLFIAIIKYSLFNIKVILTELFSVLILVVLLIELFLANNTEEVIIKALVLIFVMFFSFLLVRGVYKEIHQREKIEALAGDLQRANDRLTELNKQKSEFVSFATHQLRAPITAMKGYASLILEGDMGTVSKEARDAVSRIYDSTSTLAAIVDDYLNITRIELGTMKYSFEEISLRKLVEDTIAELKPNIEKSNLRFTFKADEDEGYKIKADKDKLKQVIANLIDNSVKYTPSGSVTVRLYHDKQGGKYVFSVKDTGIGISKDNIQNKLFQKFNRADNADKSSIKGTGLGLYVAKDIVNAHNGVIRVESAGEGRGSEFIVELKAV